MRILSIDIETYSEVDIKKSGMYKYVLDPSFEVLLFAYCYDGGPVRCISLATGEIIPTEVLRDLMNPDVLKTAHNAQFERICLSKLLGKDIPVQQWECTMIKSAMLGLPMALGQVASALKLDIQKDAAGTALISYFCKPCKPTIRNEQRTRNRPDHDMDRWNKFIDYCITDVETERAIRQKIDWFKIPQVEKELYWLDQKINDRGILVDKKFIRNAINLDIAYREELTKEAFEITGLENSNSVSQLTRWLTSETGDEITTLRKADIPHMLSKYDDDKINRMLIIRQEMSKTSVKKYTAMANSVAADGRIRGLLQFYGANRTGRWAGRLVQVQNLPKNHMADLDTARSLVRNNEGEILKMCFGNVPDTLSQLVRTAFVAGKGKTFAVPDFSAIEARVIAWFADEQWRMDIFSTHGKIYEASAAKMFNVPIEEVTKGSDLRSKGKVAELALGYQGGVGALINMGALSMGIPESDLQGIVTAWRRASPKIASLWDNVNAAAISAIEGQPVTMTRIGMRFFMDHKSLMIELPSGRRLCYHGARLKPGRFGNNEIVYWGMNQTTKQWCEETTYGGKLVENIVQAIARDCLAYSMLRLDDLGYEMVMHVHDEIVMQIPDSDDAANELKKIEGIMGMQIPWAKGLDLKAAGSLTHYYKKDD